VEQRTNLKNWLVYTNQQIMALHPDKQESLHQKSNLVKMHVQMDRLQEFLLQGDNVFKMKHIADYFDKTSKLLDESFNFQAEVRYHFEDYIQSVKLAKVQTSQKK